MPEPLDDRAGLLFSAEEVRTARAALFISRYHMDDLASDDGIFQTLTGVEVADIARLMNDIDELTGHNLEVSQILTQHLSQLNSLSDDELGRRLHQAQDVVTEAIRRNVTVPPGLQERITRVVGS